MSEPRLLANRRGQHWLNHPEKVELYDGWCMCKCAKEWGNPRLVVYFNSNQEPDTKGTIEVFDIWLPHN